MDDVVVIKAPDLSLIHISSALYWEVATGVAGFDLFQPPAFFQDLLRYDRMKGTTLARRFADQLTLVLLLSLIHIYGVPEF